MKRTETWCTSALPQTCQLINIARHSSCPNLKTQIEAGRFSKFSWRFSCTALTSHPYSGARLGALAPKQFMIPVANSLDAFAKGLFSLTVLQGKTVAHAQVSNKLKPAPSTARLTQISHVGRRNVSHTWLSAIKKCKGGRRVLAVVWSHRRTRGE